MELKLMDENEFEEFSNNLLEDRDFIIDRKEEMFIDSTGQIHGLMALKCGKWRWNFN